MPQRAYVAFELVQTKGMTQFAEQLLADGSRLFSQSVAFAKRVG